MSEQSIFEHLFMVFDFSDDEQGVVAACLVRNGEIVDAAVSMDDGTHAEYALLQKLKEKNIPIDSEDIVYTTLEPCGVRTPGGRGEKMGDCTAHLINAGVKHVIYAAPDPDASKSTRDKFAQAGATLTQVSDQVLIKKAVELFNVTCVDPQKHLTL